VRLAGGGRLKAVMQRRAWRVIADFPQRRAVEGNGSHPSYAHLPAGGRLAGRTFRLCINNETPPAVPVGIPALRDACLASPTGLDMSDRVLGCCAWREGSGVHDEGHRDGGPARPYLTILPLKSFLTGSERSYLLPLNSAANSSQPSVRMSSKEEPHVPLISVLESRAEISWPHEKSSCVDPSVQRTARVGRWHVK